jgi:hypothetical protein
MALAEFANDLLEGFFYQLLDLSAVFVKVIEFA